ncbi:NAD(P)(+)--arginine ADP-ribosyltransferase 2-like [Megalobrama amblycephala]|uniref:NAD(P)(+)--arginine ADP-ribosyltransferase 2-like n=1 Tax=Megalobrama amblycephala TaxID=75352 RepID=UPI0020143C62|nr:NAD(P)(+)--arginine ADP-ribosyltransferase 2-like [Megalobrama amblycephala]XP_048017655.1 NAD(P)(+)--arginine ADP-ribosyltransferase 2-like [Megalobrama amblycephala]
MLLIIEALLLILAALGQDHRAAAVAVEGQVFPLDMALDSVDDQYMGCRKKMEELVETKYLKNELQKSPDFNTAWKKGEDFVNNRNDKNLQKNHAIAIFVYTDATVYEYFNPATRRDKERYKHKTYEWYSLHFLLTNAIHILKKTQNQCYSTYRGTKVEFYKYVLNKEIRFGSFTSSSLDIKVAQRFGKVSCFKIHTCEGADVTKYSKLDREKEVLIPPYETFKVTDVKTKEEQKDLWCDTVFTLESTGTRSDLNCALFKKPPKTKTMYYVL